MRPQLSTRFLGVGIIGLTLLLAACGGDDDGTSDLTVGQYFDRIESLADDTTDRLNNLPEPADLAAVAASFNQTLDIFSEFLDDIEDATPPNEVRAAHDAFVAAFDEFIEANRILATQLEGATTAEEFTAILQSPPAGSDQDNFSRACADLQQVATDAGLDVDLGCNLDAP